MNIYHYLLPAHSNNFKAKVLHNVSLFAIAALILFLHSFINLVSAPGVAILGYASNIPPEKVVELTNSKRLEQGVGALRLNPLLSEAARLKALDMLEDGYWAHIAPDGKEPWDFFRSVGYAYRYAGENLARDFSDTNSAVEAWLASPSHRENMLSAKYTEIGVAVIEGDLAGKDTTLIVQLFGTPASGTPSLPVASNDNPANNTEVALNNTAEVNAASLTEIKAREVTPPVDRETQIATPVFRANQFDVMKTLVFGIVFVLLAILFIDMLVIHKKGVVRVGGRTFAHLSFMAMVAIIVLIMRAGQIL